MKKVRLFLSVFLVLSLLLSIFPAYALESKPENTDLRSVNPYIIIDDNATGGYEGDYVVIYNPATSSSTSYSTGTMTGLIETSVGTNAIAEPTRSVDPEKPFYKIDVRFVELSEKLPRV